ncbi:PREDICTED: UV radiation resistance-associated gene protein-like [Poecilia mexicana]|uniref:UV radiation resistance-associated gene protein-like n=1 Tax=Poecilia mexicana TaxID=48701 RepID=UPI00072ED503|nr:PREDICTED: UV radiation resistance-associated gene protein-like [Poecilia mexicana]
MFCSLVLQLRYQHGLTTPDLQQTLPNLKNFLEHGLMVRCDRHHVSSSIPVPSKLQLGVSATSETGYPHHNSSPDRGPRKRASSEAEAQLKYKPTPSPNNKAAAGEERPPANLTPPSPAPKHVSSSLDASTANMVEEEEEEEEEGEGEQQAGPREVEEKNKTAGVGWEADKQKESEERPASSAGASSSSAVQEAGEETVSSNHTGAMNGSLATGQAPLGLVPELHCSVEQAEEIMGTEATGLGLGVGLGLTDEARLDDYHCIPVDHAVAVECDEQVLGELDVAGFEEFNRRIYALNENMSSFRRPRKNSDK